MSLLFKNILLLFCLLLCTACGQQKELRALQKNQQALVKMKEGDASAAQALIIEALQEQPFSAVLMYNLAVTQDQLRLFPEAISSYEVTNSGGQNQELQFYTRFNLGEIYGRQKKIDQALNWYQKALELQPDSKEVKTNIELLLQQNNQNQQKQNQDQKQDQKQDQQDKNQQQGDQSQDKKDDQKKQSEDQGQSEKDKKEEQNKDGEKKEEKPPQSMQSGPRYQPRPFKGELSEADVKKILGEIQQQEQKIRKEFNKKDTKEAPRGKDW